MTLSNEQLQEILVVTFIAAALIIVGHWFVPDGWWLSSGRGVKITIGLVMVLAFLSAVRPGPVWPRVLAVSLGSVIGSAMAFIEWSGAQTGNLVGLVLLAACIPIVSAAALGGLVGMLVKRFFNPDLSRT